MVNESSSFSIGARNPTNVIWPDTNHVQRYASVFERSASVTHLSMNEFECFTN